MQASNHRLCFDPREDNVSGFIACFVTEVKHDPRAKIFELSAERDESTVNDDVVFGMIIGGLGFDTVLIGGKYMHSVFETLLSVPTCTMRPRHLNCVTISLTPFSTSFLGSNRKTVSST